ncbi:hypothetical protein J5Y09_12915 [Roseomonas sp. PWR1]|uniref:Uncharacterized protein n=1 Tax=Roseomonas nitratireducens TaxID=2820810 RepID=A0ABS4ATX3_9PROT|nr:hypothetical protein [Neoroseomonas nitratireducens]MBP0464815.1 hypothetical protein [Neoroseomonas nitratireducens]
MTLPQPPQGTFRRILRWLRRWSLRGVFLIAVANLAWDVWSWHDRTFAEGDRRYFRQAERADDVDYGYAELRVVNETSRDFLIEGLALEGWNWHPPSPRTDHILARAGEHGSSLDAQTYVFRLLSPGYLRLRDRAGGETRRVDFDADRRRPASCRIELRIQEHGEMVSGCRPLHRLPPSFQWLAGPENY